MADNKRYNKVITKNILKNNYCSRCKFMKGFVRYPTTDWCAVSAYCPELESCISFLPISKPHN